MKASISLTTVLVIGAMLMLTSITLLTTSLDLMQATSSYSNTKIAKINADACLEEAMARIKINNTFTGDGSLNINNGTCTFYVSNYLGDPTQKQVDTSGSVNGSNYYGSSLADLTKSPIEVSTL